MSEMEHADEDDQHDDTGCSDSSDNLINQWRARLLEGAADVFGTEPAATEPVVDVTVLYAKIGELTLANDFLAGALGKSLP